MSYQDILDENIEREFNEFKAEQLALGTETMFENVGKIHFYKEVYTYLSEINLNSDLGWRNVKKLAANNNLIGLLYDEYLSKENLCIGTWQFIQEIIESFLNVDNR